MINSKGAVQPVAQHPTTRRRETPGLNSKAYRKYVQIHNPTGSKTVHTDGYGGSTIVLKPGTQVTVSEGHPFHSRNKRELKDLGGDFFTQRSYYDKLPSVVNLNRSVKTTLFTDNHQYTGLVLPTNPSTLQFPLPLNSSETELTKQGATAIARCKPTNSVADVSTFLGELMKDRLPDLPGTSTWKSRTLTARNAGEEFLNVEFGWLPLASEVKSLTHAMHRADAVLKQYERDAGKVVRRTYNFPVQRTIEEQPWDQAPAQAYYTGASALGNISGLEPSFGPLGRSYRTVETVRRQWFSGAFTYALPSGYDSRNAMDRYALMAKQVFGAQLSPEVLWNLAPWSWAADWFSNTGDVISNISDWQSDGLVMRYGYFMEHTVHKHTYTLPVSGVLNNTYKVQPLTLVTETKIRRKANPFGFGITWDGLSPLQTAIAAAIGITR